MDCILIRMCCSAISIRREGGSYWLRTKFEAISMYVLYSFAWAAKPIISAIFSTPLLLQVVTFRIVSCVHRATRRPFVDYKREGSVEEGKEELTHSSNLHSKSPQPTSRDQHLLPTSILRELPPKNFKDRRITCFPFFFSEITPVPDKRP